MPSSFALAGLALKFPLIALAVVVVAFVVCVAVLTYVVRTLRRLFTRRRQSLFGEQPA